MQPPDRRALAGQQEQLAQLRQKVGRLKDMAKRNAKDKVTQPPLGSTPRLLACVDVGQGLTGYCSIKFRQAELSKITKVHPSRVALPFNSIAVPYITGPPLCTTLQVMLPQIQRALGEAQKQLDAAEQEHSRTHQSIQQKEKEKRWTKF